MNHTSLPALLAITLLVAACSPVYKISQDNWSEIAQLNEAVAARTVYIEMMSGRIQEARALHVDRTYDPVATFIVDGPGTPRTVQVELAEIRRIGYRNPSDGLRDGFGVGAVIGLSAAAIYNLSAPYSGTEAAALGKTDAVPTTNIEFADGGKIGMAALTGGLVGALIQRSKGSDVVWEIRSK